MPLTASPVSRILSLVKLDRKEISAVYFYAILNGLIQLSVPIGIQAIVGFVLGASMRASLIVLILLVVMGVLSAGIMQINQMKLIEKIQQKIFVRYSFAFADHIPRMDLRKNDSVYLPELVNRFFDIPVLQKSLSKILLDIPTASIQILFGLILLSFYHPAFILFGIMLIILLWLILRYTGEHGLQTSIEESSFKYKVAAWLEEMARVVKSFKLSGNQTMHLQKTDELVTGYLNGRTRHFKILLLQYNVLVLFKTVITAAMLIVGTFLLVNQQLNIGQFIAAEIVILLVLGSVEKLIMTLSHVYDTLTAVEKLANLTDKPVEESGSMPFPANQAGVKLELKQVSFGFLPDKQVLQDVTLLINPGEKVLITGKDGSGKSTLLQLLAGAYSGFSGAVLLDGVPAGNYDIASFRAQTGVQLGQQDIFLGTLWENITMGNSGLRPENIIECCHRAGLDEFMAGLPQGFDSLLDPAGKRLPKSVVQKIMLVRALVSGPRLLLLEAPHLLMNEAQSRECLAWLTSIPHTTLVITGTENDVSAGFHKIIKMEDGRVTVTVNHNQ